MADSEMQARFSVAMCTYNGERYLREQLDTIAAQTRPPCELVVCDDGSQDGTLAILEAFARTAAFPVRIHRNPEQLGSTRNFDQAIRLCAGEYIALSDQDDRWRSEKLARLGAMLDQDPGVGVVFSDAALIDAHSKPTGRFLWKAFRFGPAAHALFATHPGRLMIRSNIVTGATMVFRRSLLMYFPRIPLRWVHDAWITWMGILWMRTLSTPEPLTEYRLHTAQQLGVGKTSLAVRIRAVRKGERVRYLSVAHEFEDLLAYVQQQSSSAVAAQWSDLLKRKIAFLHACATAPASLPRRLLFLIQHAPSYYHFARGWHSMLKDCLLGPFETL